MSSRISVHQVTLDPNPINSGHVEKWFGAFIAILFPATMDGTKFGFQACATPDGTFKTVVGEGEVPISITFTANSWVTLNPSVQARLAPLPHIKVVPETTQQASRAITVVVKE